MSARLSAAWSRLDPRLRWLLLAGVIVFALLEAWQLALRPPFGRWQSLTAQRQGLERTVGAAADRTAAAAVIEAEIARLERRVGGDAPGLTTEQLVVAIVARLDRLAQHHGVTLAAVKPGERRDVLMFEEVSFDIKAMGKYDSMVAWLGELQQALGPLIVTRFDMRPSGADGALAVEVGIAAYRAPAGGER